MRVATLDHSFRSDFGPTPWGSPAAPIDAIFFVEKISRIGPEHASFPPDLDCGRPAFTVQARWQARVSRTGWGLALCNFPSPAARAILLQFPRPRARRSEPRACHAMAVRDCRAAAAAATPVPPPPIVRRSVPSVLPSALSDMLRAYPE